MAKAEKELEEEIIKKIGKYDFLNEIEIKEPKEPNIIDGKEYVIGFNLEEETNEYKNMTYYPEKDSIKIINNTVVVKLSD